MTQKELAAELQKDLTPEELAKLVEQTTLADLLTVKVTHTPAKTN